MTKEELIKESWGKLMPEYTNIDLNNGWSLNDFNEEDFNDIDFHTQQIYTPCKIRPKSLQGIENNNGWIKIESEADLPNYNGLTDYHVFNFTNQYKHIRTTYKKREVKELWEQEEITHYQPIEKPKTPIY